MTDKDLSHNLLMAHVCIRAANECLKAVYEFRGKIDNKEIIEVIKQVKPKLSFYNQVIDKTFLEATEFKTKHFKEIEEKSFEALDSIHEHIKKV